MPSSSHRERISCPNGKHAAQVLGMKRHHFRLQLPFKNIFYEEAFLQNQNHHVTWANSFLTKHESCNSRNSCRESGFSSLAIRNRLVSDLACLRQCEKSQNESTHTCAICGQGCQPSHSNSIPSVCTNSR